MCWIDEVDGELTTLLRGACEEKQIWASSGLRYIPCSGFENFLCRIAKLWTLACRYGLAWLPVLTTSADSTSQHRCPRAVLVNMCSGVAMDLGFGCNTRGSWSRRMPLAAVTGISQLPSHWLWPDLSPACGHTGPRSRSHDVLCTSKLGHHGHAMAKKREGLDLMASEANMPFLYDSRQLFSTTSHHRLCINGGQRGIVQDHHT